MVGVLPEEIALFILRSLDRQNLSSTWRKRLKMETDT